MTRKDYQFLADIAKESAQSGNFTAKGYGRHIQLTADRLGEKNPQFNRYKFLKACGVV